MTISSTKIAMSLNLLTFLFWSFVTIGSRSLLREFETFVLFVVARMLLLEMLGLSFYLATKVLLDVPAMLIMQELILISNQGITKRFKRGWFVTSP
jgi:hypothetical protein